MNELHETNQPVAARVAGGGPETRLMMMNIAIRRYRPGEEEALWCLYHDTTHRINGRDYTPEQCERWAPAIPDMSQWTERIRARNPFVAEHDGQILGFAELEPDGHIDFFYCHHAHQRQGVGRRLYEVLEAEATRLRIPSLHAAVSTNAKAFFLRMGFLVEKEQRNIVCGVVAPNTIMRKELPARTEPKGTCVAQLEGSTAPLSSARVEVRPALDADAEAAVEVLRRSITEVCLADHQNDAPTLERWLRNKTPERFRSWRSAPDNFLVVAVCAGVICGVGAIRQSGDLDLLYVHPSYQRKGIGRALLMGLESRAREWGIPTIRLIASATARPFYEHFGYEYLPAESSPGYGVLYDYRYRKLLASDLRDAGMDRSSQTGCHSSLTFRQLTPAEEAAGYQVICDTVDWLRAKGIKLWEKPLPRETYAARQARGENFGLFVDGELGVIVSLVNGVPEYWSAEANGVRPLWLCTLATATKFRGRELGREAVRLALQRARGRAVYLDCKPGWLEKFYESFAFVAVQQKTLALDHGPCGPFEVTLMRWMAASRET